MAETIDARSRMILEAPNFCHVATLRRDGTPHVVPTWVDVEGDQVLLNSVEGRVWPRNLARDPRVTLTIQRREDPYEFVSVRGRAEITREGAVEHINRLAHKYTGEDYPLQEGEQRLLVRVTPERVRLGHG